MYTGESDARKFLSFYAPISMNINIIFLALANAVVIFGFALSDIYHEKSARRSSSMHS